MATDITTTSLPDGFLNREYEAEVVAADGTAPYTYSVATGDLPDGLSLDADTGEITGTPTVLGEFTFEIEAVDSTSPTPGDDTVEFTIVITKPSRVTNKQVDEAAAAVAGPYGPLTRVTDVEEFEGNNRHMRFEFTDQLGKTVLASYDELIDAQAIARQIALAEGVSYTVNKLIEQVDDLYTYTDGIDNSNGGPYTQEQYEQIIAKLRDIHEISGLL